MKNLLSFLSTFLLFFYFNSFSQSFSYRKVDYTWPKEKPEAISLENQYAKQDAVILDEKCMYNISGNQTPPYNFLVLAGRGFYIDESSDSKNPIVQKHLRIKYLNDAGIKKHSTFILPESFDPSHDRVLVPHLKRNSVRRPRGEFECIRYFAARIIKPDGTIQKAIVNETTEVEVQPRNGRDETLYSWVFNVQNLEPGDELELEYAYEGAFTIHPSGHVFFNGEMPKQNYQLTMRHRSTDYFIMINHNGAFAGDTALVKGSTMNYKDYIYHAKNLKGGITETGSRPVNELPYICYYRHHMDFGKYANNSTTITYPLPYPWWYKLSPLLSFQLENLKFYLKKMDMTTSRINAFVDEERKKITDTTTAALMSSIQHTIADQFEYQDDIDYIEGADNKLEKLGKNIENKNLRYISRYRFYDEIFLRMDQDYYLTVLHDKRTDNLDPQQYEQLGSDEIAYAVPYKNNLFYYYPKTNRFGYEANELPFYYENIIVPLIPQHLPLEMKSDINPEVEYKFVRTPNSSISDNSRRTNALVQISVDALTASTKGKLKLSGQYSTLTRGYFLYHSVDTTVSPEYYRSILDLADAGQKTKVEKEIISSEYPFDATFSYSFQKTNFIRKENDREFSFTLNGWFNNVTDKDFDAKNRQLSYFPDFQSEDIHRFMIQFDQPVQLLETAALQDTIKNKFGYYVRNVVQKDPQNILIESTLVIHAEKVPAENAADVQTIYDAIRDWNSKKYQIKKL